MKGWGVFITALAVSASMTPGPVSARPNHAATSRYCCHVASGTAVQVELTDPVGTKGRKTGDSFALRLATPLIVNGWVVLRAGTPGVGQIVEATGPGMGGKPAKLVLAARYLMPPGGARVPLDGLQLAAGGHNNSTAAQVTGLAGIAFFPLGFVGLAVQGGDVLFPANTAATAKVSADISLRPLARASRAEAFAAASSASAQASSPAADGAVVIPQAPPGEGQVVFFRKKSLLGTGQWFNVRENGAVVGKLTNGDYFVQTTTPGVHTYSATLEPELKDKLKLEVDPGETYFVEGELSKGVVVSAADLLPSDRATFEKVSGTLKQAPAPASAYDASNAPPSEVPPSGVPASGEPNSAASAASSNAQ